MRGRHEASSRAPDSTTVLPAVHEVDVLEVGATRAIDPTELPRRRRLGGISLRPGGRRLVRGVQDVRGVGQFCRAGPRLATGPEDPPRCGGACPTPETVPPMA